MNPLVEIFRNLGTVRLVTMGVVLVGLILFFVFMATRLTGANMELLYSGLDPADSNQVLAQLQQQNIAYEVEENGSRILVKSGEVGKVRLALAAEGIPGSASVGYEIFDKSSGLGTTTFIQNINAKRALEGELARTIRDLKIVKSARVHLVLPKRQLFSRDQQEATASVTLKIRGANLSREQVAAIQHLIATAVPKLNPKRVSIVDDRGNLLARGTEKEGEDVAAEDLEERRIAFQNRLERKIDDLIGKTVGNSNVKSKVTAYLDFDRITTTEELFDPDGQVVRSTQSSEEQSQSDENQGTQPVTIAQNLPDGIGSESGGPRATNRESRTSETVNFEISKKIINHVREVGIIKRLFVAVIVDGIVGIDEDGEPTYTKRPQAEMEKLAQLVRTVSGFDAQRGDTVDVIEMRFIDVEEEPEVKLEFFFGLQKQELLRIAEVIVLAILAILVILLVVRPLVSRAFEILPAAAAAAERKLLEEQAAAPAIAPPEEEEKIEEFEELIDIDRVEGRVRASSVKKVGEIVDKHPEEALSIIRTWMYQEG